MNHRKNLPNKLNLSYQKFDTDYIKKRLARNHHVRYMQFMWQKMSEKFLVGIHTREICWLIDDAIEKLRQGESTFLVIKVPFRHGKSDMISRFLPSHFLGEFPDKEVMLVTYASSLAEGFSRYARNLIRTPEYKELYPETEISRENGGVQQWGIQGRLGGCVASGLTSGLTGKGYHLGLLDDFNASRADAESEVIRNSQWEHFTNDFLTRRAPESITIVLATPWHKDDIIGRIEEKINPDSDKYDPEFPPFKIVSFPAKGGEVDVHDADGNLQHIKYDYLFPERFSNDWYAQQFASLGTYSAAALLQCNPIVRGGNLVDVSKVKIHDDIKDFPQIKYYRIWDLAHSAKQRMKDNPDWTSGTLLGFRKVNGLWELWIKNVGRIRQEAPQRDGFIFAVTEQDGDCVSIGVEQSADAKDAVTVVRYATKGRRIVKGIKTQGDKVARFSPLEPIFEAGNVHILKGDWNEPWLTEVSEFPSGKHDDQVDNLSAGYELICRQSGAVVSAGVSFSK